MSSDTYIAGTCNIGKGEVRRRQLLALVGAALSISALIGFVSAGTEPSLRLGIFIPLSAASIGWVQSRKRFCLAYGFLGTFNFGKLGQLSRVADKASLAADRKTAVNILAQSLGLAGVLTLIVYLLPLT
ncbi:hypothetical protein MCEMRE26_01042 [Candidatus Nanopelagicaceae bacterium]